MTVIDALPYYDSEPSESDRDAVDSLVEKEIPQHTPLHPSIAIRDEWQPSSPLLQQGLDRVKRGEALRAIDLARYEQVEAPVMDDIQDWRDALRRNIVAADAMNSRSDNLTLLKSLGTNAWTVHVHQLEYSLKQVESELLAVRQETEQVNIERSRAQTSAGDHLTELTERWRSLLSSNLELNVANAVLQGEIDELNT
ncbi:BCAS2 domain protein [Taphrina deformans PYCC 5710]|uniref:BCAS2 domain protein n=1 Tax=Taphrina deformans (strain PYCC 5710 / ATCC 11124 / CBS 356.35 / IMI 108563 / JCM 9778 / NBRC 8474) TaxID=1097556 RepID=R4XB11_TAPDE|nr:BCAS2 domain protein [Taphrina deformans PYCC 5710]|eukprot:CCG83059.1 BCAS2 domain protein [Taphrina deformans PYCC 5710]